MLYVSSRSLGLVVDSSFCRAFDRQSLSLVISVLIDFVLEFSPFGVQSSLPFIRHLCLFARISVNWRCWSGAPVLSTQSPRQVGQSGYMIRVAADTFPLSNSYGVYFWCLAVDCIPFVLDQKLHNIDSLLVFSLSNLSYSRLRTKRRYFAFLANNFLCILCSSSR